MGSLSAWSPSVADNCKITCLFWFESTATLRRAEEWTTASSPVKRLVPDAIPTVSFRKWVVTILSTTQVTPNVILLALLFIYRLKTLNPTVKGKAGSEYRLLTVALMLGNKCGHSHISQEEAAANSSQSSMTTLTRIRHGLRFLAYQWAKFM